MDTYYVKQPATSNEIAKACMATRVCCVAALRYGGRDHSIIKQLQNDPKFCDHMIGDDGQLVLTVNASSELLPFAQVIVDKRRVESEREYRQCNKKWWHFWL